MHKTKERERRLVARARCIVYKGKKGIDFRQPCLRTASYSTAPAVACAASAPRLMTLFSDTLLRSTEGPSFTPLTLPWFIVETVTAGAATGLAPATGKAIEEAAAAAVV